MEHGGVYARQARRLLLELDTESSLQSPHQLNGDIKRSFRFPLAAGFDDRAAKVACYMLGLTGGTVAKPGIYGTRTEPPLVFATNCSGNESSLHACALSVNQDSPQAAACESNVAVKCSGKLLRPPSCCAFKLGFAPQMHAFLIAAHAQLVQASESCLCVWSMAHAPAGAWRLGGCRGWTVTNGVLSAPLDSTMLLPKLCVAGWAWKAEKPLMLHCMGQAPCQSSPTAPHAKAMNKRCLFALSTEVVGAGPATTLWTLGLTVAQCKSNAESASRNTECPRFFPSFLLFN